MRNILLVMTATVLSACQTTPLGECRYSVKPATFKTVTETVTTWGPPTQSLVTVPAVIDPVSGEILVPASTEEPKEKYPMVLGEETRRVIKTPVQYSILGENGRSLKTLSGFEFASFQEKHNCKLTSNLSAR